MLLCWLPVNFDEIDGEGEINKSKPYPNLLVGQEHMMEQVEMELQYKEELDKHRHFQSQDTEETAPSQTDMLLKDLYVENAALTRELQKCEEQLLKSDQNSTRLQYKCKVLKIGPVSQKQYVAVQRDRKEKEPQKESHLTFLFKVTPLPNNNNPSTLQVPHHLSLSPSALLSTGCSCCDSSLPREFVTTLIKSLPKSATLILASDTDCCVSNTSSLVRELHENFTRTVLQHLTFSSSEKLRNAIRDLEETISFLSEETTNIYVFTLCLNNPRILQEVDNTYRKFPFVRWVLLTTEKRPSPLSDPNLFQNYTLSSCRVAISYQDLSDYKEGSRNAENYVIDGPNIQINNCRERTLIGRWVAKRKMLLPAMPNDFFPFVETSTLCWSGIACRNT
ncbi:uncharacterized protein LOC143228457 [Tachypleus tridentatus]|uniref:uncharacterized protein LOC143228457 n=1 Tax=Tachypleus tridentatus TaxID=6853 RepID=UPI003FD195FA